MAPRRCTSRPPSPGAASMSVSTAASVSPASATPTSATPSGGLIGGTLGYNWQFGQIVFGAEGDFDYGFLKANNGFAFAGTNSYRSTGSRPSGFASATPSTARCSTSPAVTPACRRTPLSPTLRQRLPTQDGWRSGGVIGGGIEYAFTNNITAKAEYLWPPMEDKTYWSGTPYQETNHVGLARPRRPQLQVLICVSVLGVERAGVRAGSFVWERANSYVGCFHAALGRQPLRPLRGRARPPVARPDRPHPAERGRAASSISAAAPASRPWNSRAPFPRPKSSASMSAPTC